MRLLKDSHISVLSSTHRFITETHCTETLTAMFLQVCLLWKAGLDQDTNPNSRSCLRWKSRGKLTAKSQWWTAEGTHSKLTLSSQKALPENTYVPTVRKTRVHERQQRCVFLSTFAGLLELSSHLSPALYSCTSPWAHLKDGSISEQNSQLTDSVPNRRGLGQDDLGHRRQSHLQRQRNWRICLQCGFQGNKAASYHYHFHY